MMNSILTSLLVLFSIFNRSESCSTPQNWEPWGFSRRAQKAEAVIIGTVIEYLPMFQNEENSSALFYTARVDVSCVFGVRSDALDIAKNISDLNGVVNIIGFNPRMVRCPSAEVDLSVNREYVMFVIGSVVDGDMRPQGINAQPAAVDATNSVMTDFSNAMTMGSHVGYRMKSRKCSVSNDVEVIGIVSTTTSNDGITKSNPKQIVGGGEGSGYKIQACRLSILMSIFICILM